MSRLPYLYLGKVGSFETMVLSWTPDPREEMPWVREYLPNGNKEIIPPSLPTLSLK